MCGIFGTISDSLSDEALRALVAQLRHRGPDAVGHTTVSGNVHLVHLRLAVIDLSDEGRQPMEDAATGNTIVLNGEIYNFLELREELERAGHVFRSRSDTEVLLQGYGHWGRGVLDRLVGMFAFAVWDARRRCLFLARDRMGEKPLYYTELPGGRFAFCSELRPLLLLPGVSRDVCGDALAEYWANGYVGTGHAIVRGVRKLPPAHWVEVRDGRVCGSGEYWSLAGQFGAKRAYRSFAEACDVGAEVLGRASQGQLVSDAPLGAFLSGGVDSALVVGAMRRAGADTRTFSAGFDEGDFDERGDALLASERLGTTHMAFSLGEPTFDAILAPYQACDEPFADTSAVPTFYLAKLTRGHVTVCLSGDGGDELFGGYPTYLADKLYRASRLVPRSLMGVAGTLASLVRSSHGKVGADYKANAFFRGARRGRLELAHQSWRQLFTPDEAPALLTDAWFALVRGRDPTAEVAGFWDALPAAHYLDRAMFVDMKTWLVDDILFKVDRMTMAHALESRAPFLDHRVVEFAAALPVAYKIRALQTKRLLRGVLEREYGLDYWGRRKQGFNAPASRWVVRHERAMMDYLMASGLFRELPLESLLADHRSRRRDHGFRVMSLIGLAAWVQGLRA